MAGLILLLALGIYVAISAVLIVASAKWARRNGGKPGLVALATAFVMYLLVFWDHVPTILAHHYYCNTIPDAKIYKTFEQWQAEHPNDPRPTSISSHDRARVDSSGHRISMSNSRFGARNTSESIGPLVTTITRWQHIDVVTEEVLTEFTTVSSRANSSGGIRQWKVWLNRQSCGSNTESLAAENTKFIDAPLTRR